MKDYTRVIIVRHGETEWNKRGLQQGHLDSPLTARGIKQAQYMAHALKYKHIDLLLSSDLGRALQTAEIISQQINLPIQRDSKLRERHLGIMQGKTMAEFKEKHAAEYEKFIGDDADYCMNNGESKKQRYNRHVKCLNQIVKKNVNKNILIVGHGGVLDSIIRYVLDIPLQKKRAFYLLNSAINCFIYMDNSWSLETWGDISHLKDIEALDDF